MKRLLLVLLTQCSLTAYGADTMYVQSAKAKLLESPSFSAKSITEIEKGEAVTVERKQERWIQVDHAGSKGWLPSLLLSPHKPINKISVFGDDSTISENARRRASAVITAGATRGLSADERLRIGETTRSNYADLRWMEAISVTHDEISAFEAGDDK